MPGPRPEAIAEPESRSLARPVARFCDSRFPAADWAWGPVAGRGWEERPRSGAARRCELPRWGLSRDTTCRKTKGWRAHSARSAPRWRRERKSWPVRIKNRGRRECSRVITLSEADSCRSVRAAACRTAVPTWTRTTNNRSTEHSCWRHRHCTRSNRRNSCRNRTTSSRYNLCRTQRSRRRRPNNRCTGRSRRNCRRARRPRQRERSPLGTANTAPARPGRSMSAWDDRSSPRSRCKDRCRPPACRPPWPPAGRKCGR